LGRARNIVVNASLVVASVMLTLLVIEIALRALPIDWRVPIRPPTAEDPIQRYEPNALFVTSMNWNLRCVVRDRTNAQGWISDHDYDAAASTPLLAVVGDSYIEGWGVPFGQSVAGRLQAAVGARARVYAFAQAGAPLSQYVAYARHACALYHPERLIVSIVYNDFDESLYARRAYDGFFHLRERADGHLDLALSPYVAPSLAQTIARRSALGVYLLRNAGLSRRVSGLGMDRLQVRPATAPVDTGMSPARVRDGLLAIDWFVDALPEAACLPPGHILLVVDAARAPIYRGEPESASQNRYFARMRSALIPAAAAKGYGVLDLDPVFRQAYAADREKFDFPIDSHWNAHGHAVVAAAIHASLADWPR
jgi:hypothetical protein